MKPTRNRNGVRKTGRPCQIVAIQANTETALGIAMTMLAPLKKESETVDSPVANMWCTHTPNPRIPTATVASATYTYPTSGRRQKVGIMSDAMLIAGSTMM